MEEYRARLSMDLSLRFIGSVSTTLYYVILFWVLGDTFTNDVIFTDDTKQAWSRSITFIGIYGCQDVIQFTVSILMYHYYFEFPMTQQFLSWFNMFTNKSQFIFLIYLSCVSFVSLQLFYY